MIQRESTKTVAIYDNARNVLARTTKDGSRYYHYDAGGSSIGYSERGVHYGKECWNHYRGTTKGSGQFVGRDVITEWEIEHYNAVADFTGHTPLSAMSANGYSGSDAITVNVAALAAAATISRDER